jgi:hypothetical protein
MVALCWIMSGSTRRCVELKFDADVFENSSVSSKNVVTLRLYDVAFSFHLPGTAVSEFLAL